MADGGPDGAVPDVLIGGGVDIEEEGAVEVEEEFKVLI